MTRSAGPAAHAASELAATLVRCLRDRSQTLATAESLTGGLVGAAITSVAGASLAYRGGLITYATELKATLAGVPPRVLAVDGPVAATTATRMALGAARACGADWGVATTGVAGPDPQDRHPAGQVFVAVAGPLVPSSLALSAAMSGAPAESASMSGAPASGAPIPGSSGEDALVSGKSDPASGIRVRELTLTGDRAAIREQTVTAALELLLEALGGPEVPGSHRSPA